MIRSVHYWPDGEVAAYGTDRRQICFYDEERGHRHTDIPQILRLCGDETKFIRWRWLSVDTGKADTVPSDRDDFLQWCRYHHPELIREAA